MVSRQHACTGLRVSYACCGVILPGILVLYKFADHRLYSRWRLSSLVWFDFDVAFAPSQGEVSPLVGFTGYYSGVGGDAGGNNWKPGPPGSFATG